MRINEGFSVEALCGFLEGHGPDFHDPSQVRIDPFEGGVSNLTALVTTPKRKVVVRRAPPGHKAKSAHDMVREAKILTAIAPHFPAVPKVLAVGEDDSILGTQFFVMEHLEGRTVGKNLPTRVTRAEASLLCERLVDLHVKLHELDIEATGLSSLGRPSGYIERQISGWTRRYHAAKTDDVPDFAETIRWLEENQPAESAACLIHNDFKFDNLILGASDITEIVGVVDWELAAIGDPWMDLGASLAYWVQPSDFDELRMVRTQPTNVDGMFTRAEVVQRYSEISGRSIDDFRFYYVYGLFRLAGIAQQIYARYKAGQTANSAIAGFGFAVQMLARQANAMTQGAPI